jgi:hypothetical protein
METTDYTEKAAESFFGVIESDKSETVKGGGKCEN